jgi:hypothetical protein
LPLPVNPEPGVCCVTGDWCETTIPRSMGIRDSFTNLDLLRAPGSDRIGKYAWRVLGDPMYRRYSWMVVGGDFPYMDWIDRTKARAMLVEDRERIPDDCWGMYITTSFKKHGALRTPVNRSNEQCQVLFENVVVDLSDAEKVSAWWRTKLRAMHAGIGRTLQDTLDFPASVVGKISIQECIDFRDWALERKEDPLYGFLTYLLPTQKELGNESVSPEVE